jgi:hypothetical protein
VDVGLGPFGLAASAGDADGVALGNGGAPSDLDRAEMRERDGEAVPGQDRQGDAVGGDRAGERDDTRGRRAHELTGASPDVDAAVLAGGIGVRAVGVGSKHGAAERPAPRVRPWRDRERHGDDDQQDRRPERPQSTHRAHVLLPSLSLVRGSRWLS